MAADFTRLSERQARHYESIHDEYVRTYFDSQSTRFRDQFIYDLVFGDTDFTGKTVADLASGSGYNSLALLERFPSAKTIGFDISEKACADYELLTGQKALCVDMTSGSQGFPQVDAAMVFGGLHHCIADLAGTFATIAGLVKPGGVLYMFEPNSEYILEGVRKYWYRSSRHFDAPTECALNHGQISDLASTWFTPENVTYRGGPAYFLIFNSLLFGLSPRAKKWLAPSLFALERLYNRLPGHFVFPYFVARWRRKGVVALVAEGSESQPKP